MKNIIKELATPSFVFVHNFQLLLRSYSNFEAPAGYQNYLNKALLRTLRTLNDNNYINFFRKGFSEDS